MAGAAARTSPCVRPASATPCASAPPSPPASPPTGCSGWSEHGFWIPLTILFVLRPEEEETFHRLILRAVGTAIGLVIATALAEWLRGDGVALALALTVATGFAYGLLTVQYALFTAAITTYAVLLADTLGEPALHAAGQRAAGDRDRHRHLRRRLPALAEPGGGERRPDLPQEAPAR